MKKIWMVLGLVLVSIFIVSCGTGQAVRVKAGEPAPLKQVAGQIPVLVTREMVFNQYGSPNSLPEGKTGKEVCKDIGFSGCLAVNMELEVSTFTSQDNTCSGNFKDVDRSTSLESCDTYVKSYGCFNNSYQFPTGDKSYDSKVWSVLCLK